jgi:hypothetical protein
MSISEVTAWIITFLISIIIVAVVVIFYIVYFSITWPWYLYRAARRVAHPR